MDLALVGTADRPSNRLTRNDYTVGWICALAIELAASVGMLDEVHEDPGPAARGDRNMYTLGSVAGHNVVVACLPEGSTGVVPAATVASNMLRSFPRIRLGLMVGIGGGAPPPKRVKPSEDIRLGDVVVSIPQGELGGVVKYDRGKLVAGGEFEHTGLLNLPPAALTNAVAKLRSLHEMRRSAIPRYVTAMIDKVMASEDANPAFEEQYSSPGIEYDQLFQATYDHVEHEEKDEPLSDDTNGQGDEEPLSDDDNEYIPLPCPHCDKSRLVPRKPRKFPGPVIHYGTIASADQVMRHGPSRDRVRQRYGVLCFEMEAAGLMNDFPCLVIRGICDYADTHKHKIWQRYAAATAAAYAKELLQVVLKEDVDMSEEAIRVLEKVEQGIHEIGEGVEYLIRDRQQQSRNQVLDWLDSDTHTKRFIDSYEKWQPSTVQKLLTSEKYTDWSTGDCQTLWCHGIAGGGKTVFASVVVDSLKAQTHRRPRAGVVCLFNEYERQREQTVRSLTAAMLRQLSEQCDSLPEAVTSLVDGHRDISSVRFEDLSLALTNVIKRFPQVFLVVDALDESTDDTRRELLAHLSDQQRKTGLKILATSRPTVDFQKAFGPCEAMEIQADVLDVKTVLDLAIERSDSLVKTDSELRHRVTQSIAVAVDGMFLLVQPFLDSIIGERSRGHIEDALNTLMESPDKLSTVYEGALSRIGGQKPGDRKLAHRMLSWVVQSRRPLTRGEFLHALAVRAGSLTFRRDYVIHDLDGAVALCAGLVVINQTSDTVQLMHHTTRTYFEDPQHRPDWLGDAEEMIASACITYVSLNVFEDGPCEEDEDLDERLFAYPFLSYASQHWGHHARAQQMTTALEDLALEFLRDRDKLASASQAMQVLDRRVPGYSSRYDDGVTGLHMVASFGLAGLVRHLLTDGQGVDVQDSDGRTPLHRAAESGHDDVAKELLEHGANVDAIEQTCGQTPLHLAALNGHRAVAQLLVDHGATVDIKDADGWMAIHVTAWTGNEGVTRALLESSTDGSNVIDGRTDDGLTALHCAAAQGHSNIAQLLIRGGADVDARDEDGWTPLHWAAKKRHDVMRPRMLSLRNESSSTLLRQFHAFQEELNEIVMNEGLATVKKTLDYWENKLAWLPGGVQLHIEGSAGGYGEIMAALQMTTSLQSNTISGHLWEGIVGESSRRSRSRSRRRDAKDKKPPPPTRFIFAIQDELTAMHCSTECGHEAVARILLRNGARIEARCKADVELDQWISTVQSHPTALHLASFSGHEAMVRLLLKQGANIDTRTDPDPQPQEGDPEKGGSGMSLEASWTALYCGVVSGSDEVVQMLLDDGADVLEPGKVSFMNMDWEVTPLHVAVMMGHPSQVQLLLANGVDADAPARMTMKREMPEPLVNLTSRFRTDGGEAEEDSQDQESQDKEPLICLRIPPLHLATVLDRDDMIQALVDKDANVDAPFTVWFGTVEFTLSALHVAVLGRREKAAGLFLDNGADPKWKMSISDESGGVKTHVELTLLHVVALKRHHEGLPELLLASGADVDAGLEVSVEGWQPPSTKQKDKGKEKVEEEEGEEEEDEGRIRLDRFLTRTIDNFTLLIGDELDDIPLLGHAIKGFGKQDDAMYSLHMNLLPLTLATLRRNNEVVRVFTDHGAAVNAESTLTVNKLSIQFAALHMASLNGSTVIVQDLLDAGADINAELRVSPGAGLEVRIPALHLAAISGNEGLVQLLLDAGSDVGKRCIVNHDSHDNVLTALHFAALWGRQEVVSVLLDAGADPKETCRLRLSDGLVDLEMTTLHLAAFSGNTSIVETLLDREDCDAHASVRLDAYGLHAELTLIHLATLWTQEGVLEELLRRGHDVDAVCVVKFEFHTVALPVLHLAAFSGNVDVMSKLIRADADVLQRLVITGDEFNTELTVLHLAILARQQEMIEFLLDTPGLDIHANVQFDVYGTQLTFSPLHLSMFWSRSKMAMMLLERGFDVNAKFLIEGEDTHSELTALHMAVALGKGRLALNLINHGADTNARLQIVTDDINVDLTALHMAVARHNPAAVQMLTSADISVQDRYFESESDMSDSSSVYSSSYDSYSYYSSMPSRSRSRSPPRSRSPRRFRSRRRQRSPSLLQRSRSRSPRRFRSRRRQRSSSLLQRSGSRLPQRPRSRSMEDHLRRRARRLARTSPSSSRGRAGSKSRNSSRSTSPKLDSRLEKPRPLRKALDDLAKHPFAMAVTTATGLNNWRNAVGRRAKRRGTDPDQGESSASMPLEQDSQMNRAARTSFADPNAVLLFNSGGVRIQLTALHLATALRTNNKAILQHLIKATADADSILKMESTGGNNSVELTPLHIAVLRRSIGSVQTLVGAGASVEAVARLRIARFYAEVSPLQMVTALAHWEIAQFLLGHRASTEAKHPFGFAGFGGGIGSRSGELRTDVAFWQLLVLSRLGDDLARLAEGGGGLDIYTRGETAIQVWLHTALSADDMAREHKDEDMKNLYAQYHGLDGEEGQREAEEGKGGAKSENWFSKTVFLVVTAMAHKNLVDVVLTTVPDINATETLDFHVKLDANFGIPAQADVKVTLGLDIEAALSGLHVAAALGNVDMASMIIERGASLESKCEVTAEDIMRAQLTVLNLATLARRTSMIQKLLDEGASIYSVAYINLNKTVRASLIIPHISAIVGQDRISRFFLPQEDDIIAIKIVAEPASVHLAVLAGDMASIVTLIEHRETSVVETICTVNIQAKTNASRAQVDMDMRLTPLHLAVWAGHVRVVEALLKRGARIDTPIQATGTATVHRTVRVNRKIQIGGTALHLAACLGKEEIVRLLIDNGASIRLRSHDGRTAQEWAQDRGHEDVVRLLAAQTATGSRDNDKSERRQHRERWHDILVKGGFGGDEQSLEHVANASSSTSQARVYHQEGLGTVFTRWITRRAREKQDKQDKQDKQSDKERREEQVDDEID